MFNKFFSFLKTIFYIANFVLISLYIFPGSILGWLFYGNAGLQPQITSDFLVSSNHVYAFILLFFKQYNDIPMSTTWVFVGLLCGREFAIASVSNGSYKLKHVFPIVGKDFLKMMLGLIVSVGIVIAIHSMN